MNSITATLADLASTTASLALDHIRALAVIMLAVMALAGWHSAVHHLVAQQAANVSAFDQLARPLPAKVAMVTAPQRQWIPLQ